MENEVLSENLPEQPVEKQDIKGWAFVFAYIKVFPVTSLMMIVSIVLFILVSIYSRFEGDFAYLRFGAVIGNPGQILLWQGQLWRLALNPYHHGGLLHIFFNLYALYYFGSLAERFMGSWKLFVFVLLCGTFQAAFCQITIEPGAIGISGIMFALFGFLWIIKDQDKYIKSFLTQDIIKIMFVQLFVFIALTYFKVLNIANIGHFFGLLYGILFAYSFYLKPNLIKKIIFIILNLLIIPTFYQAYKPVNDPGWQEWHNAGEPTLQELLKENK
jgi:membrane associated rhomboid family serine protease